MKKYLVLKKIGDFSAVVEREFDEFDAAFAFTMLLMASEDNERIRYYVAETIG